MEKKLYTYFACMLVGAGIFAAVNALDDFATSRNQAILQIAEELIGHAPGFVISTLIKNFSFIVTIAAVLSCALVFRIASVVFIANKERRELYDYFAINITKIINSLKELEQRDDQIIAEIKEIRKIIQKTKIRLEVDSIDDL